MIELLSFFLLPLLFVQCSATARYNPSRNNKTRFTKSEESSLVRVLLDEDLGKKTVSFDIPVLLKEGQEKVTEIAPGQAFYIAADEKGVSLSVGGSKYSLGLCAIEPENQEEYLTYKGKTYKGSFSILNSKGKLLLVNSLGLEDYLKGVLYSEMGVASVREDDLEALKAFAVCARNYAIMRLKQTGRQFDLYSDIRDQVYGGYNPSKTLISRAVDETAHLVLKYNGALATVFYSSSCGGRTENSDNVFMQKSIPYLKGVSEGEEAFCRIAPGYNWEESYTDKEIVSFLISAGYLKKGDYTVKDIVIKSRYDSGRVNELVISLEDSEAEPLDVIIVGNKIRYVIRSKTARNLLKSTMFDVSPVYEEGRLIRLSFKGRGNGHGVGLCQWGAIGQSRQGKKFEDILSLYFPGTVLEEMY